MEFSVLILNEKSTKELASVMRVRILFFVLKNKGIEKKYLNNS